MPGIEETDAYARLRWDWDTAYDFSYQPDSPEPYRAARRDGRGTLEAKDPEALRKAVQRDYIACKVPREFGP